MGFLSIAGGIWTRSLVWPLEGSTRSWVDSDSDWVCFLKQLRFDKNMGDFFANQLKLTHVFFWPIPQDSESLISRVVFFFRNQKSSQDLFGCFSSSKTLPPSTPSPLFRMTRHEVSSHMSQALATAAGGLARMAEGGPRKAVEGAFVCQKSWVF